MQLNIKWMLINISYGKIALEIMLVLVLKEVQFVLTKKIKGACLTYTLVSFGWIKQTIARAFNRTFSGLKLSSSLFLMCWDQSFYCVKTTPQATVPYAF